MGYPCWIQMKTRVGVFFGGKSGEHEVSRVSATTVINSLDRDKYDVVTIGITKKGEWLLYEGPTSLIAPGDWEEKAREDLARDPEHFGFSVLGSAGRQLTDLIDFALPIMHGPNGEDGTIQGVFELLNIPYGGTGVAGCAVTMDKIIAKEVFADAGLKQSPYLAFSAGDIEKGIEKKINEGLEYPLFIKPANMGSSVGITKVTREEDLLPALKLAARYDSRLVAEHGIDAREIEIAVMGNDELSFGAIGEIVPGAEFYDYDAKYNNDDSKLLIPAPLTDEQAAAVREMAGKAYKASACCGFSRVDFLMDKSSSEIYINEINAIPGFTSISMFPMLMMETGLTLPEITDKIIELGYERYSTKNNR